MLQGDGPSGVIPDLSILLNTLSIRIFNTSCEYVSCFVIHSLRTRPPPSQPTHSIPTGPSGVLGSPLWKPGKNQPTFFRPKQHLVDATSASTSASTSPFSNFKLAPFGQPSRDPPIFSPKPIRGARGAAGRGGWSPRGGPGPNRSLSFSPQKRRHQQTQPSGLPPPPPCGKSIDEMYRSLGLSTASFDDHDNNNFVAPRRFVAYPSPIKFSAQNYDRFSDDEEDDVIPTPQPPKSAAGGAAKKEPHYPIMRTPSKGKGGPRSPKRDSQMPLPPWSPLSPGSASKWTKNDDGKWIECVPQKSSGPLSILVPGNPQYRSPRGRGRGMMYSPTKPLPPSSPMPQQRPKAWNVRSKWRRGAKTAAAAEGGLVVAPAAAGDAGGGGVEKMGERVGGKNLDDVIAAVASKTEVEFVRSPRSSFITLESILPSFFTSTTTTAATTTSLGVAPINLSMSEPSAVSADVSDEDQMDTMWKWIQWGVSSKVPQARYASEKNSDEVAVPIPPLKQPIIPVLPPMLPEALPPVPPPLAVLPPMPGPDDDSKHTSKTTSVTATPFYHTAANSGTTTPFFHDTLNLLDGDGDGYDPINTKQTSPSPSLASSQKSLQEKLSELSRQQQLQQQPQSQPQQPQLQQTMEQHHSMDEEVVDKGESSTWADVSSPNP